MDEKKEIKSKRLMDATLGDLAELLISMGFQVTSRTEAFNSVPLDLMDIESCAALTGYAPDYIRQLVFKRSIPFYKNPKRKPVRFKRSEILAWMATKKYTPINEQAENYVTDNKPFKQ